MNLERYDYVTDPTYESFIFDSVGPKGVITKIVSYHPIQDYILPDGRQVVNLGFGDWDEKIKRVDDVCVSNNLDREKVLATVASTIFAYTDKHGHLPIFATGTNPVKTRLYQMGINANLQEIEQIFDVYGFHGDEWHQFVRGVNYEAFMVIRK